MSTYRGSTTLLLDGDRELTANATLSKDSAGTWGGTLMFPASARTPELINLPQGRLRVGDREGAFVRPDTSDWVGSPVGQLRIRILGNGDAPF